MILLFHYYLTVTLLNNCIYITHLNKLIKVIKYVRFFFRIILSGTYKWNDCILVFKMYLTV